MTNLIFTEGIFNKFSDFDPQLEQLIGYYITIMLTAVVVCFLVSEITRNYSQVDKLWSLMPIIYSLVTLINFPYPRIWIMTCLTAAWGLRLSYNFYRKGGYNLIPWKGEEDYRWKIIRQNPKLKGWFRFGLFNLLFISFYQHFLVLLFSSPLLMAAKYGDSSLTLTDLVAASMMLGFIVIETIADNQQFRFHKLKQQTGQTGYPLADSLKKGFLSAGLWRYVRHPNFASEQAIWISFYLFSVSASGQWINWTLSGAFLLVILFLGSTKLTERLSSEKYPEYATYKKEVPKYLPRLFRQEKH